ncbi:hypothetical protein JB92DRAFT_3102430 [Gautieria morchelliformis]|nr:hypothetical protein JB92DRAFT_3102430 [Gautieria morchelliformis]
MTATSLDPPVAYTVILGPMLLGHLFEWGLFGILGLQTYLYFLWFPRDRYHVKWLVAILFGLDTLKTAVCAYNTWTMLVSGWGDTDVLLTTPWSLCLAVILTGIISSIVQLFFAHRAWMIGKSVAVTSIIVAISLTQCASAFEGAVQVWVSQPDDSQLLPKFRAFALWLSSSVACDVVIATSMVYFLVRMKPKSSLQTADALVTRLINISVQSGTLTAVCAGVDLILFLTFRSNNLHDLAFFMLSKLCSNTLLANLNARRSLHVTENIEAPSTSAVLSDPQVLSLGLWPEPSEGMSVSETTLEQVCHGPSNGSTFKSSSAGETDVPTPSLIPGKGLQRTSYLS